MWKKILFVSIACIITFVFGFGTGYFYYSRSYAESRERTERELGQLRDTLTDARVRSDTAIRGLDEAVRGLGAITDRNKRIEHLIAAIRATVVQLRAIYERTGETVSATTQEQGPVETSNNR